MGEILLILVLALVFIGPKKLPGLAKTLGKSLRDLQRAKDGFFDQIEHEQRQQETPPAPPQASDAIEAEYRSGPQDQGDSPPAPSEGHTPQKK